MNRILSICTRHWHFLAAFNLFIIAVTVGKLVSSPQNWTAKAQLVVPNTSGNLDANLGKLGSLRSSGIDFSTVVDPLKEQQSILNSNSVLRQVLAADPQADQFTSIAQYRNLFDVSIAEKSTTLDLIVDASSPELARQRTATWIDAYQQRLNELRQVDNESRQQFSQKRLETAQQKLAATENKLAKFKQNSRLVSPEEQTEGLVKIINDLTYQQKQAQAKAQAKQEQIKTISNRLGLSPAQAVRSLSLAENKDYQFVRNKLVEVETDLAQLRSVYTDEAPRVQTLLLEQEQLQRQLQKYTGRTTGKSPVDFTVVSDPQGWADIIQQLVLLESEATAQAQEAERLQAQIEQINETLESIPVEQAKLQELERQKNIAEGVYQGLVAQVEQSSINSFNAFPNVQIIDPPEAYSSPSTPNENLIVLSSILASVVGSAALLLLLESRNPLLSPKDLQFSNFPIVVCLPKFRPSRMVQGLCPQAEVEFEKLASAISSQPRQSHHRLLITSSTTGEGKTTVTLGLAKAFADLGFKVLVVDGDYRKAELSRRLGYLQGDPSDQPVQIQTNLDLLFTTPQQGKIAALVSQGEFAQRLAAGESAGNYDFVLVDSPPVSHTSETVLMTSVISSLLFVVRPGTSQHNSVMSSLEQLNQHEARILGLVVNGVETNAKQYSYRSNSAVSLASSQQ